MSEVANYEQSIKRLEEIVARLESGRLPLEESISLYNEGIKLSAECRKTLESASLTVNVKDDE
ncbi:MAG: exodeoxyribonuclease VII small subunit [Ruminococcus sp.]|nr:exodeoxyribonuclease VII small subunit [Ruminococcus sp.]